MRKIDRDTIEAHLDKTAAVALHRRAIYARWPMELEVVDLAQDGSEYSLINAYAPGGEERRSIEGATRCWVRDTVSVDTLNRHDDGDNSLHTLRHEGGYVRGPVAVVRYFDDAHLFHPDSKVVDKTQAKRGRADGWCVVWRPLGVRVTMPLDTLTEGKNFATAFAHALDANGARYTVENRDIGFSLKVGVLDRAMRLMRKQGIDVVSPGTFQGADERIDA